MFRIFYNIVISLALVMLVMLWPFSKKLKYFFKQRGLAPDHQRSKIKFWIHCASLGEFEMALPIINEILKKHDKNKLLITFFSPSGYNQAIKDERVKDSITYLPMETEPNVKNFYDKYNPEIAIFVRYELWYHYLREGLGRSVDFYLLNARFKEQHFIFKWYTKAYRNLLMQFKQLFVSDEKSKEILESKDFSNVVFTGDLRYDRLNDLIANTAENEDLVKFKSDHLLLILGSSWEREENLLLNSLDLLDNCKIIIAPHSIEESRIQSIESKFKDYGIGRISKEGFNAERKLLILDSIGQLSSMYKSADVSFVGGGFSGALHNIIEPLAWGSPVIFGPKVDKFPEAIAAEKAGIAKRVSQASEIVDFIQSFKANKMDYKAKLEGFNTKNLGAKETVLSYLKI